MPLPQKRMPLKEISRPNVTDGSLDLFDKIKGPCLANPAFSASLPALLTSSRLGTVTRHPQSLNIHHAIARCAPRAAMIKDWAPL
jgi:hypothetical protein